MDSSYKNQIYFIDFNRPPYLVLNILMIVSILIGLYITILFHESFIGPLLVFIGTLAVMFPSFLSLFRKYNVNHNRKGMNIKFPGQKNTNLVYKKITRVEEIDNCLEIVHDQKLHRFDLKDIQEIDRIKLIEILKTRTKS